MKVIITQGDNNGIGIEVMLKGILDFDKGNRGKEVEFHICANPKTLMEYLNNYSFPIEFIHDSIIIGDRSCPIISCVNYSSIEFGKETKSAGILAAESIEKAVKRCLSKEFDAMVTMPVSKAVLYNAGWEYPGHTEMLAARCNITKPLMILCTRDIRVGLITVHIPITEVPKGVTESSIKVISSIFNNSLKNDYGFSNPRIALLGLNPHAGEDGGIGNEELDVVIPTVKNLKSQGINIDGPYPADGFFAHGEYKDFDGILAMYHDQGLIPLKLLAEGAGINYTAGLPIVRTSPDHGTAFGIAGKNLASGKSVKEALILAKHISQNRDINNYS